MRQEQANVYGEVLDELRANGPHFRAVLVVSFENGAAEHIASAVSALGGTVRRVLPRIGAMWTLFPLGKVAELANVAGVSSVELESKLTLA